jgi:heat shock protein HtpX
MSNLKVFVLLAGLTALFGIVGYGIGGQQGMFLALIFAGIMNFIAYFKSDKMVLKAYQARVVSREEAPELHEIIDRIRQRADLPMPTVAIAPHRQPNAFATGRNPEHAVVCVTEGILDLVDRDELEGVLAHEIGHIKNRDMLLNTVSATLAGAISYLAKFGFYMGGNRREGGAGFGILAVFLAPLAAMLIQFTISRQREFKADRTGAELSGKPPALASALEKLEAGARRIPMRVAPAVAPLAQVNPLSAFGGMAKLFSTHPSTAERVARLREMAGASAFAA